MIRVRKSSEIPESLKVADCRSYDGQDVQDKLYSDQDGKCYLCEQETHKSFQIEHLRAKDLFHELEFDWNNLFLSCGFCNGRKPNRLDQILHPAQYNIEEIIQQRISFGENVVKFISDQSSESITQTIELLKIQLNGKNNIRDRKTWIYFEDLKLEVNNFMEFLIEFKKNKDDQNKQKVIDSLHITKEFLGVKYWIIKDNLELYEEFKSHIVWNKVS